MQTLEEKTRISEVINSVLNYKSRSRSRVYFRNQERVPMFGQFIKMRDYSELWNKGMVRLLPDSKIPKHQFHGETVWVAKETDTKILTISEIASIRNF